MSDQMFELAQKQDGFLGVESAREDLGISVSYWRDLESIRKWKENADHVIARRKGREIWYKSFSTRIALVESEYHFFKAED
jgi:heme-degrading monooxygenase HmoA